MGKGTVSERLFYRIGEVSDLLEVEPHVLRYWEQEFPWVRPGKTRGGQRRYRARDIELLRRIKQLLREEGYTVEGARRRLESELRESMSSGGDGDASEDETPDQLRARLEEAIHARVTLEDQQRRLNHRLEEYRALMEEVRQEVVELLEILGPSKLNEDEPNG